jgi:MFS family permease
MFYSFIAVFLASIGFKEGLIGNIQSITTITCLIVNPIWSMVAKNNKTSRILMVVLSIIEGTILIIYSNMTTVESIMLFTALMAIAASPYYTIMDGHAATYCETHNKLYSNVRVVGSIAYMIGAALGGILIDLIGFTYTFTISGLLFVLVGVMAKFLKAVDKKNVTEENSKESFKTILTNKLFIIYAISYLFIVTLSIIGDNYVSLLFTKELGLTVSEYSFIYSAMIIVEVAIMILAGYLFKDTEPHKLVLIAGVAYFFRALIVSFTSFPVWILIIGTCLRGVGWGLVLFVHFRYLIRLVGIENATRAAFIITVLGSTFNFIVSNFIGYVFEDIGYNYTYKILAFITLVSTLIFFILTKSTQEKMANHKMM